MGVHCGLPGPTGSWTFSQMQKMHLDMVHFLHYTNMAHKRYKISVDSYVVNYCLMYTFSEYV